MGHRHPRSAASAASTESCHRQGIATATTRPLTCMACCRGAGRQGPPQPVRCQPPWVTTQLLHPSRVVVVVVSCCRSSARPPSLVAAHNLAALRRSHTAAPRRSRLRRPAAPRRSLLRRPPSHRPATARVHHPAGHRHA
uniref:Uncharacterized protein n=1 Tax=Arundo donax TaxID=35708 RepID=A0A0A9CAJ1_ARUDO